MPDITIIKLKIRRGTDAQRKTVVLEQGELGYAVDTGRLFIGDGITTGGNSVSPTFHLPLDTQNLRTTTNAAHGDIVNEAGGLYQLIGTDSTKLSAWRFIGAETDEETIAYTTKGQRRVLSIKNNSIGSNNFRSDAAYIDGGLVATPANGLSANTDGTTLTIDTLTKKLKVRQINHTHISSTSLSSGLKGGSSERLSVNLKADGGLEFDNSGRLFVSGLPTGIGIITLNNINFDQTFDSTKGLIRGDNNKVQTKFYDREDPISWNGTTGVLGLNYNPTHFKIDTTRLTLNETFPTSQLKTQATGYLQSVAISDNGRITGTTSTIVDVLSASASSPGLTAFNGYALDVKTLTPGITATTSSGVVVTLSSAGFLTLSGVTTQTGRVIPNRIAIPIYLY